MSPPAFESAACGAALSFTLVGAQSITADRRGKSRHGTGKKKEKGKRRAETVINPRQFLCVTT